MIPNVTSNTPWAVRLSWLENFYLRPFSSVGDFGPKSRSQWPNFGVWSGFISRSVHARLQVSVCSGYNVPPWLTCRHTQTGFWPAYMKSSASWAENAELNLNAQTQWNQMIGDGKKQKKHPFLWNCSITSFQLPISKTDYQLAGGIVWNWWGVFTLLFPPHPFHLRFMLNAWLYARY